MKSKSLSLVLALLVTLSFSTTAFAQTDKSADTIISAENYQKDQFDNSTLVDMALKGNKVNNDKTQVDVFDEDCTVTQEHSAKTTYDTINKQESKVKVKLVRIKKLINKTTYKNGETIENHSVSTTVMIKDAEKGNTKLQQDYDKTQLVGTKELLNNNFLSNKQMIRNYDSGGTFKTGHSGSYTVYLTNEIDYESRIFGGVATAYKATYYSAKAQLYDTSFRLYSLSQKLTASGQGYTASGATTYVNESSITVPVNYPTSGVAYGATSGFTKYLYPSDGSGIGLTATIKYKRNTTGVISTYSYNLPFTP